MMDGICKQIRLLCVDLDRSSSPFNIVQPTLVAESYYFLLAMDLLGLMGDFEEEMGNIKFQITANTQCLDEKRSIFEFVSMSFVFIILILAMLS